MRLRLWNTGNMKTEGEEKDREERTKIEKKRIRERRSKKIKYI